MGKKKTRPNGISARIVKKRSEANGRQKVLRRVNFGIEQGGRQKFMLRWRFQVVDFKGLCLSGNHQTWLSFGSPDKNQRQSGYPQKKTDLKGFSHPPNQRQQHTHTKKADPPHIPTGLERHGQGHVEREHRGEQRVHRHQRRRQLPPADAPGDSPELIPIGKDQGLPERTDGVGSKRMGTQKSLCLCWSQKRGTQNPCVFFGGFHLTSCLPWQSAEMVLSGELPCHAGRQRRPFLCGVHCFGEPTKQGRKGRHWPLGRLLRLALKGHGWGASPKQSFRLL